jgi:hypothetical protein
MSQRMPRQPLVRDSQGDGIGSSAAFGFVSRIIALSASLYAAAHGQQSVLVQASAGPDSESAKTHGIAPDLKAAESVLQFNGKTWKPSDNAIFMSRFEKFLNTPEENGEAEQEHRKTLNQIIALLDPNILKPGTLSEAFRLLARASTFLGDSRLCDTLANAIYSVWQSKRNQIILGEANKILEEEVEKKRRSTSISAAEKVAENKAKITANGARSALSELQAKIDFQGILIQLFMQRRFHHVAIGTRFYRAIFTDGDSRLNIDKTVAQALNNGSGSAPTVATLESLGNEAMRDIQLTTQAFHRLYEKGELRSATERLRDALMIGEHMPELRTVPLKRKRDVLSFLQKVQQLEGSLETLNFTLADELINGADGLKTIAKDFDLSKPQGVIDTAKAAAHLYLVKARSAANSGDTAKFEIAIQEAARIWPNNPELKEVSEATFKLGDTAHQALAELDQLISHKNFSRIGREAGRFLAAAQTATPERRAKLLEILEQVKSIESSITRAQEFSKKGDYSGAWESLDQPARNFPDELEINRLRSEYAIKAPAFVSAIENGRKSEDRSQLAVSLSWYLKAQRLYPGSEIALQAQTRIAPLLLQGF